MVRKSRKESSQDEAREKRPSFVLNQVWARRRRRQGSAMNARPKAPGALDPASGARKKTCAHKGLDTADAVIDALPLLSKLNDTPPHALPFPPEGARQREFELVDWPQWARGRHLRRASGVHVT